MTSRFQETDFANLYRRSSFAECPRSSPPNPAGSKNALLAYSKETPCLPSLLSAFLESHSNIALCIYLTRSIRKPRLSRWEKGFRLKVEGLDGKQGQAPAGTVPHRDGPSSQPEPATLGSAHWSSPMLSAKMKRPAPLRGLALLFRFSVEGFRGKG